MRGSKPDPAVFLVFRPDKNGTLIDWDTHIHWAAVILMVQELTRGGMLDPGSRLAKKKKGSGKRLTPKERAKMKKQREKELRRRKREQKGKK